MIWFACSPMPASMSMVCPSHCSSVQSPCPTSRYVTVRPLPGMGVAAASGAFPLSRPAPNHMESPAMTSASRMVIRWFWACELRPRFGWDMGHISCKKRAGRIPPPERERRKTQKSLCKQYTDIFSYRSPKCNPAAARMRGRPRGFSDLFYPFLRQSSAARMRAFARARAASGVEMFISMPARLEIRLGAVQRGLGTGKVDVRRALGRAGEHGHVPGGDIHRARGSRHSNAPCRRSCSARRRT